jgi:hypothetical protein
MPPQTVPTEPGQRSRLIQRQHPIIEGRRRKPTLSAETSRFCPGEPGLRAGIVDHLSFSSVAAHDGATPVTAPAVNHAGEG